MNAAITTATYHAATAIVLLAGPLALLGVVISWIGAAAAWHDPSIWNDFTMLAGATLALATLAGVAGAVVARIDAVKGAK